MLACGSSPMPWWKSEVQAKLGGEGVGVVEVGVGGVQIYSVYNWKQTAREENLQKLES